MTPDRSRPLATSTRGRIAEILLPLDDARWRRLTLDQKVAETVVAAPVRLAVAALFAVPSLVAQAVEACPRPGVVAWVARNAHVRRIR